MAIADHPRTNQAVIDVHNPVTQDLIGKIPITSRDDVEVIVERARFSQRTWVKLTVKERLFFFRRWLDMLWERQQEGINILRRENGKSDSSAFIEFTVLDSVIQWQLHHAENILKPESRRTALPIMQHATVYHKPHGVVGVITPWNYPFFLPFADCIPALIAGNTVVMKPSEHAPFITEWGVDLMYEVGIPRDVIQVVHGDGKTGAAVVDNVDYVQFTGSTTVGKVIAKACVDRLIPYTLELGGKDPAIVLNDADIETTAVRLIHGAFENAGQMCISIERVYVEDSAHDNLVNALKRLAQDITVGADKDAVMGSMTNLNEVNRTLAHIKDAVAKGATILHGGKHRPDLGEYFIEPTILINCDHTMDIMVDETFGPVMPIMRVQDVEEAIELANESIYGLSASVFTSDLKRGEEIAQRIDSGDVSVNRAQFVFATPALPSGGNKLSGTGRRNGKEGLLKYTQPQSVLVDKMLIKEHDVQIATPLFVNGLKALRVIRRYVPFV